MQSIDMVLYALACRIELLAVIRGKDDSQVITGSYYWEYGGRFHRITVKYRNRNDHEHNKKDDGDEENCF